MGADAVEVHSKITSRLANQSIYIPSGRCQEMSVVERTGDVDAPVLASISSAPNLHPISPFAPPSSPGAVSEVLGRLSDPQFFHYPVSNVAE